VELPLTHPLAGIHGSGLGLILHTDLMGDVLTAELDATTQQTAYAILADLLALRARR
jgi:homoserine dehydrogenase